LILPVILSDTTGEGGRDAGRAAQQAAV